MPLTGVDMTIAFVAKWSLVAARMLPLLVIVGLSAPAWISWPFLSAARQQVVLEMVRTLAEWSTASTHEHREADMHGRKK